MSFPTRLSWLAMLGGYRLSGSSSVWGELSLAMGGAIGLSKTIGLSNSSRGIRTGVPFGTRSWYVEFAFGRPHPDVITPRPLPSPQ